MSDFTHDMMKLNTELVDPKYEDKDLAYEISKICERHNFELMGETYKGNRLMQHKGGHFCQLRSDWYSAFDEIDPPEGYEFVSWDEVEEGDTVYTWGTHNEKPHAWGPYSVLDKKNKRLTRGEDTYFPEPQQYLLKEK